MTEYTTQDFFSMHNAFVAEADPEVAEALEAERRRQKEGLELIASENFVSLGVMAAMGSVMTNKYAEGYPAKRYYGGCQFVDVAEDLARDRAKKLFGADHANVQPHSGAQANMGVYLAVMKPGDTLLGWTSTTAAISPTVIRSISPACSTTWSRTVSTRKPRRSITMWFATWPWNTSPA